MPRFIVMGGLFGAMAHLQVECENEYKALNAWAEKLAEHEPDTKGWAFQEGDGVGSVGSWWYGKNGRKTWSVDVVNIDDDRTDMQCCWNDHKDWFYFNGHYDYGSY